MKSVRPLVAALLLLTALVGCAGYLSVAPDLVDVEVERGDVVRVTRHDASFVEFRVVALEADALYGPGLRVDRREIRRLDKWTQGGPFLRGTRDALEVAVTACVVTVAAAVALVL
ncbi:MAG: hypothetical protein AAGB93_05765 [Planctomycetota bacterium]